MRHFNRIAVFALAVSVAGDAACGGANAPESELLAIEARWNDAILRADTAYVNALLVPDYQLLFAAEPPIEREAVMRSVTSPGRAIATNGSRDQAVRVYGNTGVITGVYFETGSVQGRAYQMENRYTDVYVREAGRWKAASAHASRIAATVAPADSVRK